MAKLKTAVFRIVMLVIILAIGATIASTFYFNYQKAHEKIPPRVINASVIQVTTSDFQGVTKNSGFIQTSISSSLRILAPGKVAQIFVKPGQTVTKGELILQLDTKAQQSQLAAQEAKVDAARLSYQGLQAVYQQGGASLIAVEQAKANYNQLQSSIKALKDQLDNSKITAPFSGVLGAVNVAVGDVVQAGQPLASIVPNKNTELTPYVDLGTTTGVLNELSIGNGAKAYDEHGQLLGVGKITAIDNNISPLTGLAKIRVSFESSPLLTEGRFVKVFINTNPISNAIVIPDIAVNYTLYGQTVYAITPLTPEETSQVKLYVDKNADTDLAQKKLLNSIYKVKELFITSDVHVDNIALVTKGLKPGQIIITNSTQIQDGSFVRVIPGYGMGIPNTFKLPEIALPANHNFQSQDQNSNLEIRSYKPRISQTQTSFPSVAQVPANSTNTVTLKP